MVYRNQVPSFGEHGSQEAEAVTITVWDSGGMVNSLTIRQPLLGFRSFCLGMNGDADLPITHPAARRHRPLPLVRVGRDRVYLCLGPRMDGELETTGSDSPRVPFAQLFVRGIPSRHFAGIRTMRLDRRARAHIRLGPYRLLISVEEAELQINRPPVSIRDRCLMTAAMAVPLSIVLALLCVPPDTGALGLEPPAPAAKGNEERPTKTASLPVRVMTEPRGACGTLYARCRWASYKESGLLSERCPRLLWCLDALPASSGYAGHNPRGYR